MYLVFYMACRSTIFSLEADALVSALRTDTKRHHAQDLHRCSPECEGGWEFNQSNLSHCQGDGGGVVESSRVSRRGVESSQSSRQSSRLDYELRGAGLMIALSLAREPSLLVG